MAWILASAGAWGEARKVLLEAPRWIDGVHCSAVAFLDVDGHLLNCRLATDLRLAAGAVPAGSVVMMGPDRRVNVVFLATDARLDGHVCRGEGHDYMTGFHPGGELRLCWLKSDEVIDGVPCRRAGFWADLIGETVGVTFHPDGSLRQCEISHSYSRGHCSFERGDAIRVDETGRAAKLRDGNLQRCE